MRQSDSVSEELDTENVQCALDFENTMNELETQLYYRHLPPKEVALRVMEAACKFYDADWCGLIQVDLDLGLWKPLWWHNECQEDKTTILTNEFESSEFLDRWVKAVRRGTPMVVSDAEDVKDTYPDEYRLYERLGIKSVLAIPLEPRQIALIAVRNPQRYTHQTSMLKLLAYVLLAAYNDKRMADSLSMAFSPENIKSSHDVFISLFGELKIHTSHGVLPESDLKSPKISRLLTFMLLSNKKALSSLEIVQEIWPEELEDKDERTFEDFLAFLQLHLELKTWEIGSEPILSLPGLQIYPDRRKIYHGQQEIELNTKEFALLCLLVTNKGRVLTYGQMYEKVWKEEPFGNEHIAVGSHVRSMRQKLYAIYPKPPFVISCIRDIGYRFEVHS